ncbi:MAG: hydantoinase/oxoprolinase family protein [Pseudomonas sp.]|uniref:hydantoinase/oxoprolinase family protein n=1 Tax=Pseudomonas sp. TaxID=306 RepID=UPI00398299CF
MVSHAKQQNSATAHARFCIGVDVGGTFTDIVLSDGQQVWRGKAPSTTGALGGGVIAACRLVAERAGISVESMLSRVDRFGLGTTAVTNDIASRTGRKVGLITTRGFEDLIPIARVRRVPRDGWLVPPDGLIERDWIVGVDERIDRDGDVLQTLDSAQAVAAAQHLKQELGVEALVVSFLWSCVNPAHEAAAVAAIREALPGMPVLSAAALYPVEREYERTMFALLNAYTSASLDGIEELVEELGRLGLARPPLLIHSGGGSITVAEGRGTPAMLAESGPAAGVVGAQAVCRAAGVANAVACDMGGTSFDMAIVRHGEPLRRTRGELMGIWTAMPMVDIESVTAGGGSLAWVDALGLLRVGPRSAGAYPGPACYGRGGTEATVTDALVVLGYIDPSRFLGGDMGLDRAAALQACARLGEQLGSDAMQTAWGIYEIAKVEMVRALRAQFAQKGLDATEHAIVSMGGCGGLFNASIAQELGIRRVLVPELTSVLSAFGAANADIRRERSRSISLLLPCPAETVQARLDELRQAVLADLSADGVADDDRSVTLEADLRFMRQQWELPVACSSGLDTAEQQRIIEEFKAEYGRRYGQGALVSGTPVELVALRAIGCGRTVRADLTAQEPQRTAGDGTPLSGLRTLYLDAARPAFEVQVVDGSALQPGHTVEGPALVDSSDTTLWIPQGVRAIVDAYRTLNLEILQ